MDSQHTPAAPDSSKGGRAARRLYPGDAVPFLALSAITFGLWWTPAERILLSRAEVVQWLQIELFVLLASLPMAALHAFIAAHAKRNGMEARLRDVVWNYLIHAGGVGIFVYLAGSPLLLALFCGSLLAHAAGLRNSSADNLAGVLLLNVAGLVTFNALFLLIILLTPFLPLPAPHPPYPAAFQGWRFSVDGHVALAWAAVYCLAFGVTTMFRETLFRRLVGRARVR